MPVQLKLYQIGEKGFRAFPKYYCSFCEFSLNDLYKFLVGFLKWNFLWHVHLRLLELFAFLVLKMTL